MGKSLMTTGRMVIIRSIGYKIKINEERKCAPILFHTQPVVRWASTVSRCEYKLSSSKFDGEAERMLIFVQPSACC